MERNVMPTGRQTKLTPALQTAITQAVALGVPLVSAANYAGVSKPTILEWLQRGQGTHASRSRTKLYADFADAIAYARAQDEIRRLARLEQAARGGAVVYRKTTETVNAQGEVVRRVTEERTTEPAWSADAWVLERSRPETWGPRAKVDLRLTIEAAAAKVAAELGLTVEEVLTEAKLLLEEVDRGDSQ